MKRTLVFCLCIGLLLGGCTSLQGKRSNSSLVDFLYPKEEAEAMKPAGKPRLRLPLRVAVAFVPGNGRGDGFAPSAVLQEELLREVRAAFEERPYIDSIQIVPAAYLRPGAGFTGLEQLSRLLGFDVIALVSYDQVLNEEERKSSLLYWTIAGMYLVKGERNTMHSFVDTAIFDMRTRSLLLRAPGVDVRAANTTLVEKTASARALAEAGMRNAMQEMTRSLDAELVAFEQRIRQDQSVEIIGADGKNASAGGAPSLALLAPLFGLALLRRDARARRKPAVDRGVCFLLPSAESRWSRV